MRNPVLALAVMLGCAAFGTACNAILDIKEKEAVDAGAIDVPGAGSFAVTIAKPLTRLVVGQDASVDVALVRAGAFAGEVAVLVSGLPAGVSVEPLTFRSDETKRQLVFHASDSAVLGQATLSVIPASSIGLREPISLTLIVQRAPGSLDMTFGVSGRLVPLPVGTTGQGLGFGGLLAAPDGSIFLCGQARTATGDSAVLLARLTVDGALDPTFGSGGIALVNSVGSVVDVCNGAFLRPSGGVVFAGFSRPGASRDLMAARFSFTGHASGDFGSAGFVTRAFGAADSAGCCVLAGDADKLIVGGSRADGPVLIRYLRNADLDTTFGPGSGIVTVGPPGVGARWLAQQSTGHFVMAVDSSPFRVLRFTPDGVPAGFADGEAAAIEVGGHAFSAASVALVKAGDGVIVIGTATGDSGTKDIALEFLTSSGQIDTSVRALGWNIVHFGQADSTVSSAALQPDGAFVVAGQSPTDAGQAFSVLRFAPDGSVDPTFGPAGRRTFDVNGTAQATAIDALGRIVVAGLAGNAADSSIVVYRLWP